jgi:hypothetical protein
LNTAAQQKENPLEAKKATDGLRWVLHQQSWQSPVFPVNIMNYNMLDVLFDVVSNV